MKGIYCYVDKKNSSIIYIGKDSNIDVNKRHNDHLRQSMYDNQVINRILQNNPDRYKYYVLKSGDFNQEELNNLEIDYIKKYNPKFNFTKGGDGSIGYKHTDEAKRKMSESRKGRTTWMKGKHHSKKTKLKISEKMQCQNMNKFAKIIKFGKFDSKQRYCIYRNGENYKNSIYPSKLLEWFTKKYPNEILILSEGSDRTVKGE